LVAVIGRSLSIDLLLEGLEATIELASDSDGTMVGAIVDAIDIDLAWSLPAVVEDAMLVVLVCEPGAGG
jgi:hypothetical protein